MTVPGRITISTRAARETVRAVAASEFGARAADVRAHVTEAGATFDVRVETPMRTPDGAMTEAATDAQRALTERAEELVGMPLSPIEVRITSLGDARARVR